MNIVNRLKTSIGFMARSALVLAAVVFVQPAAQAQELITNGGFESPGTDGATPTGWTKDFNSYGAGNWTPHTGGWLMHPGASAASGGEYQDITTVVGGTYSVSFWAQNWGGSNPGSSHLDVLIGVPGTDIFNFPNGAPAHSTSKFAAGVTDTSFLVAGGWQQYTFTFTATATTTRFGLYNSRKTADTYYSPNVDDVSVVPLIFSVTVTSPLNSQSFLPGSSITSTAAVVNGSAPFSVTFYTNFNGGAYAPAGSSGTAPYTVALGTLEVGTYGIYAAVTDSLSATAFSATNTFAVSTPPSSFFWTHAGSGAWSGAANWTNDQGVVLAPATAGSANYLLAFNEAGTYTASNNLAAGFLLNGLSFGGATVTLAGNSLTFTNNVATLPQISQNSTAAITVGNNVVLDADTTFGGSGNGTVTVNGVLSGGGGLTKAGASTLTFGGANTYNGATVINAGTLTLAGASSPPTVQNPSFEGPAYTPNGFIYRSSMNSLQQTEWVWSDGVLLNGASGWGYSTPYPNGSQACSLQNTMNPSQPLYFSAGTYTLSWSHARRTGQVNPYYFQLNSVNQGGTFSAPGNSWSTTSATFTIPSAGTYTIGFLGTMTDDKSVALDNISLSGTVVYAGSLPTNTALTIAAGGTFDVSAIPAYALGAGATLTASGTGTTTGTTAAEIKGGAGGTVSLGSRPVTLNYDGSNPALYVSQGTLSLNGNAFTVSSATPLDIGAYTVAQQASGNIATAGAYPAATGTAIAEGKTGVITVSGGMVILTITGVDHFVISTIPSPQTAGTPITGITVTAQDSGNATVENFTGTVTFGGTAGVTGTSGSFTAGVLTGFSVTPTAAGSGKTFVVTGYGKTSTATFDVDPGAASTLVFTAQPSGGTAGSPWATQPAVTALDAYGNTATGSVDAITLAVASGTPASGGPGTLGGTKTVAAVNGVATFSGLSLDKVGAGYKLTATGDGLTGTNSTAFTVTPGAATALSVTGFPNPQPKGQSSSVTVTATDAYGNTATDYTGTVTLTSSDGAASLPGSHIFEGADAGVYRFINVTLNSIGTYAITAGDGNLTGTQSGISVTAVPALSTFSTPGTYTWTAPGGVTSIRLLVVGGGGAGGLGGGAGGGGAGG
ncbi:MAG: autotransporter-associated beta strand repeat-containing protein, partial [bacterium]